MSSELAIDASQDANEATEFSVQIEKVYATIERLEDAVATAAKREQALLKEKKQLRETNVKLEKKASSADEDIKFIKEHLSQAKKDKEQAGLNAKKERERIVAAAKQEQDTLIEEIKQLKSRNKQLRHNMEKVTSKLDSAITKISELMEE